MPFARAEASSFRVRKVEFGGIPALELRDERSGAYAVFARRGATLLAWRVPHAGEMVPLTDGYATAVEFDSQNGVRNGILAPFCNRIADGRYRFDDRDFDLLPGVPHGQRLIYHGFLREMDLSVADVQESLAGASALFTGAIRPNDFPGYPFALKLNVRVSFTARAIALTITGTNIGERAIPYSAGWHPYFRLGDAPIETLELTVPAARCVVTDGNLLPLPGEAAYTPVTQAPLPDFREPRPIGDAVIDGCYAGAEAEADGLIRSRLRDPATGRRLTMWQRGGLTHVFTGDTLARDARRSIAIEPVEVMTDAFNRDDCTRTIRLPPGTTSSFSCGVEFDVDSAPATFNSASSAIE
ncbi:hypothetical protein AZKH_2718 [Azoarcus sp. KH32C]|nr:hypothetical protein AZKH_2718 [Azoarcus sp. KH32C]